ncbi:MAG TPA: hypothetical protein VFU50_13660 [Terriglobales bacterium]|nr:hypothetical protein [Terriglobales bacterium]
MRTRNFLFVVGLCLVAVACYGADPTMGTWKLNEAKSRIPKGPKNKTVVYEAAGDDVKITIDGVDGAGNRTHDEWTGKFDGNDYPVTGNPREDTRALKKINDHTYTVTSKKDGQTTVTGHIVIDPDGKTRTVTTMRTGPNGKKITSRAVYDKR